MVDMNTVLQHNQTSRILELELNQVMYKNTVMVFLEGHYITLEKKHFFFVTHFNIFLSL